MTLDVLIRGGTVVDGTLAPRFAGDVGIRGDRIVAIGRVDERANRVIDADGLVVSPGFVDIHTHYDAQVLWDPALTPSSLHGVTTVIGGNCGFTLAPITETDTGYITRMLARVEGMPLPALESGVPFDWRSFGQYLDRLEGTLAINAGFLVGHCALRRVVMGEEAVGRAATDAERASMARLLGESIGGGGLGFSSTQAGSHNDGEGNPVPSRFADVEELLELCAVVRAHAGSVLQFIPTLAPFTPEHMGLMTSMSLTANRPINWNALPINAAREADARKRLQASDYAAERGARVVALTIADPVSSYLNFESGMVLDAIPGWRETLRLPPLERKAALAEPAVRERMAAGARSDEVGSLVDVVDWERMTVVETFSAGNEGLAGCLIGDIARQRHCDPLDTLLDIVIQDDLRTVVLPIVTGDDDASWKLRSDIWMDERTLIGASDAGAHLDMLSTFNYTTSVLASVRRRAVVSLEQAVHLMTDKPARLYGLRERGRIAKGHFADVVVFDEATVGPRPVEWRDDLPGGAGRLYAEADGIAHVLVNGREMLGAGRLTGETPGRVLRSGRDTYTVEVAGGSVPAHV